VKITAAWLIAFCVFASASIVSAQEPTPTKESTVQVEKKRSKPRGRLPHHYGKVVSEDQRLKIYEIQKDFLVKIEKLLSELATVRKEMDKEVESVLKPDQIKRVKELAAEAEARRKQRAAERAAASKQLDSSQE